VTVSILVASALVIIFKSVFNSERGRSRGELDFFGVLAVM